jgi:hypothetical protein
MHPMIYTVNTVRVSFSGLTVPRRSESETLCVVCKSAIPSGAQICTACKSPQDWTRYIFRWKEVIATIITAAPLFAGAYSLYQIATRVEHPKIHAFAVECLKDQAQLAIANDGNAIGLLSRPKLAVRRNGREEATDLKVTFDDPGGFPVVFAPKQTAAVTAKPTAGSLAGEYPSAGPAGTCELEFQIKSQDSDGKITPVNARCPCPAKQ